MAQQAILAQPVTSSPLWQLMRHHLVIAYLILVFTLAWGCMTPILLSRQPLIVGLFHSAFNMLSGQ